MENKDLQFRVLMEEDLETLRKWRMKSEVTKYLYTDPILTIEDQKKWYEELQTKFDAYWILNFKGVDVGYATLRDIKNKSADPGVFIAETEYRRKGIAKSALISIQEFAFGPLDLHKLYGPILSENYGALLFYLKNGWKIEGVLRDHIFKDRFYDVYMVALLKEDWLKFKKD